MRVTLRSVLGPLVLASVVGCSHGDPVLSSMEAALRAQLGPRARPRVGYMMPDSARLLVDFEAAVLPDTTQTTFDATARRVATVVAGRYPNRSGLVAVMVSAGETLHPGAFRVLRQRTVMAGELR